MSFSLQATAPKVFLWQRANHVVFLARNILLAYYITPSEFGNFSAALNLASYVAIFSALEFRTAFFTTKELSAKQMNTQWSVELILNALTLCFGLLLVPWLETTRSSQVVTAMLCLLIVNLIEASFSTHLYLLEKNLHYPFLTGMYTVVNFTSFLICLTIAVMGGGWIALVVDRIVSAGMKGLILRKKSNWNPSFQFSMKSIRYYWSFVYILFLTGLLSKVLFGFDIYAIAKWIGSQENGIYTMAMKWALLPMELGAGFLAIMALSVYSRQSSHENIQIFRASYTELTFHIARFCIAIAVLMLIFMKDFFYIFYGHQWQMVPLIFATLLPYAILRPLYQNVCQALQARKKLWILFGVMLVQSVLVVSVIWLILPKGLLAIGLAVALALGVGYLALELYLYRMIKHPLFSLFALPIILAALAITIWIFLPQEPTLTAFGFRSCLALIYLAIAGWEWWIRRQRLNTLLEC